MSFGTQKQAPTQQEAASGSVSGMVSTSRTAPPAALTPASQQLLTDIRPVGQG